ncbi:DUF4232 domain-containing protein [Streptomyces sp. A5-4]|uniref:DUF4232 domain-containing protein n=1 Tax=Streptomyces sp. A5-4 TaxID=3384771 RepID=UPI003DA7FD32
MPTSRMRTAALAATTAALTLTLTACGGSDGAADESSGARDGVSNGVGNANSSRGSETTVRAGAETAAEPPLPSVEKGTPKTGSARGTVTSSGGDSTVGSTGVRPCNGDEMSYTVLHRFVRQQGEHLLITARNDDSKPCWVTSYPSVILGDTSDVVHHSAKDAPGGSTRTTIRPGGRVYSAVNLFTDSAKSHTSVALSLAMRDRTGDTGPGTEQDAFGATGAPSEFTWSNADVLNWNTAKPYNF